MKRIYDLLIRGGRIMPKPGTEAVIDPGFIAISEGKIVRMGFMDQLSSDVRAKQTIDGAKTLVMPGLVNCHCHGAMTLFRGLADDLPLMTWLSEHIFPAEARYVNEEMVYWCSKLAAAEMLLSGTTTVADSYFFEGAAARAFMETGLRAMVAQGIIDFPAPGVGDPSRNIGEGVAFLEDCRKNNFDITTPALFCHSPYTCGPETLIQAKKAADAHQNLFFIHAAETREEVDEIHKKYGRSPISHLAHLGILDMHTVCVHCVHLDRDDLEILAQSGAKVATCPESNMKLAAGTAPVAAMLKMGIPVGLGTDGCASNNDLDLFGEMASLARVHKLVEGDSTVLSAQEVLNMATHMGAHVLGLSQILGTLAEGMAADIIILDLDQPHLTPFYNHDLLVYAAKGSDVRTVCVNGRVVVENRKIISFDLEETKAWVREQAEKIVRGRQR